MPLALLKLKPPFEVEFHQKHFAPEEEDDKWLPQVGTKNWIVIGHDKKFHKNQSELDAIKKYNIGCFYLWGANDKRWEKARLFFRAYKQIEQKVNNTPRPFIFVVYKNGNIRRIALP